MVVMPPSIKSTFKKKVLDFLKKRELDASVSEIAEAVGCSVATASMYLRILEAEKIIVSRKAGSAVLFRLEGLPHA